MFVFSAGFHKMLVRIANKEDPDLGLSISVWQFSVQNFRTFTAVMKIKCKDLFTNRNLS